MLAEHTLSDTTEYVLIPSEKTKKERISLIPLEKSFLMGFTLIELIAVVVIFGIVAMLALPRYFRAREQSYDKKAQAALEMIRSAERQHWMENDSYFPASGTTVTNLNFINGNLSLDLVNDGMWLYSITNPSGEFQATLTRAGGWGFDRSWSINATRVNAWCSGICP